MLELKDICLTFHKGSADEKQVLKDLSLQVADGDFISILGTNGAGKSTLFNVISGSLMADQGIILLDGEDITAWKEHRRSKMIGRLFQDPSRGTAPHMTIEENLGLAYGRGKQRTLHRAIRKSDRQLFRKKLAAFGLGLEDRLQVKAGLLSGGQRQVLSLLMATIVTPKLLLLDEHTAALDPHTARQVMKLSDALIKEHHITTLMITHNVRQALEYGNKTLVLQEGRITKVLEGEQRKEMSSEELLKLYGAP